jgi:SAM-dependent methyltransferase
MFVFSNLITGYIRGQLLRLIHRKEQCPVCDSSSFPYDAVDFNKSCTELHGKILPPTGISIIYYRCVYCGFCFSPEIARWSITEFEERIYNKDYVVVDPDYVDERPRRHANEFAEMFPNRDLSFRHLDYGGGNGLLSSQLSQLGWQSRSYDPFVDRDTRIDQIGRFDLITAIEVFEHIPDPKKLMDDLSRLIKPDGIILFSTLLSDGELAQYRRLTWWYASPRNGHISLFSRQSLSILAENNGFRFGSFSAGTHCMWRNVPPWAEKILSAFL